LTWWELLAKISKLIGWQQQRFCFRLDDKNWNFSKITFLKIYRITILPKLIYLDSQNVFWRIFKNNLAVEELSFMKRIYEKKSKQISRIRKSKDKLDLFTILVILSSFVIQNFQNKDFLFVYYSLDFIQL
jgi:hypothetical protein